jgi:predicted O-methyltransferase YrrM
MDKEEIIKKAENIYGAMSKKELETLYDFANILPPNSVVVEIGCYAGKSTAVLGCVAKYKDLHFVCVDNFSTPGDGIRKGNDMRDLFLRNMESVGARFQLEYDFSHMVAKRFDKPIDLLFIDGDHTEVMLTVDCDYWLPKVRQDGIVIFHDYNSSWQGVKKVVDSLGLITVGQSDSMIIKRKFYN